jgi:beta-glucosidase
MVDDMKHRQTDLEAATNSCQVDTSARAKKSMLRTVEPRHVGQWLLCFWPELATLAIFVVGNMAMVAIPNNRFLFAGIYGAASLWGIIFAMGIPLGVLHLLRLVISVCWRFCSWVYHMRKPQTEDVEHDMNRCQGKPLGVYRWKRQVIDISVVIALYFTLSIASVIAWGRCPTFSVSNVPVSELVAQLRFPDNFKFGSATSAYQVEGGLYNTNWHAFENFTHANGKPGIVDHQRAGLAADMWNLFDDDLRRMQSLHLETYRLSLSWSRLHPTRDSFDMGALMRYRRWLLALRNASIEPMVTLLHYEEPLWITDQGSWTNPQTVHEWLRFVDLVATNLGDVVDMWVTQNEPVVMAGLGWLEGRWPPGKVSTFGQWWSVMVNLMDAHKKAFHALHKVDTHDADSDGSAASVGIAKNFNVFQPANLWNVFDPLMAGCMNLMVNTFFLAGIDADNTLDWFGVNHYFLMQVSFPGYEFVETASSLHTAVCQVSSHHRKGLPLHITEHGTSDGSIIDSRREKIVVSSLAGVQDAIQMGVPIRSYQYWSLLDNFEWSDGFYPKYGLFEVNFTTQERIPRNFTALYGKIAQSHVAHHGRT